MDGIKVKDFFENKEALRLNLDCLKAIGFALTNLPEGVVDSNISTLGLMVVAHTERCIMALEEK